MEILIVIEIEPYDYEKNNYKRPNGSINEKQDEWSELWFKCISDSGIKDLEPIKKGSWFVDIRDLNFENLKIIIEKHLQKANLSNLEDELLALSGGIAIKENDRIIIEPQCCSDFSDIYEWNELEYNESYKQIWIGHPWIFYKYQNEKIIFTDYYEKELNEIEDISEKIKIDKKKFLIQTQKIELMINDFTKKINKVLRENNIENTELISNILMGK